MHVKIVTRRIYTLAVFTCEKDVFVTYRTIVTIGVSSIGWLGG